MKTLPIEARMKLTAGVGLMLMLISFLITIR